VRSSKHQKQVEEETTVEEVVEEVEERKRCMKKPDVDCVDEYDSETLNSVGVEDGRGSIHLADPDLVVEKDQGTVIITQHEVEHHGHSHIHTHLHSAPNNISSIAWMVMMGDGIHNLADGMAIGAAFASGFLPGVSTSIAVLCHELPHEIGDFAMLLKAGMSIKQAIFYNVISSSLSFIGMILGIMLGTITSVTPWIFSITAGIFLYVALVDMLPELSSGHAHPATKDSYGLKVFMVEVGLQLLGMFFGVSIMLLIALHEQNMLELFDQDSSGTGRA